MKQARINEIITIYFPIDKFSDEQRDTARLACENVEREVRQEATSAVFDLANSLSKKPRD